MSREVLTSDRTYYVRTDGSDSNNGLTNNSTGAFLTLQKATNVIFQDLDTRKYNVTVQVGPGTYTGGVGINRNKVGSGMVIYNGDQSTPANVFLNVTGSCFYIGNCTTIVRITGFRMAAVGGTCIYANNFSYVQHGYNQYGSANVHYFANQKSTVQSIGPYTINGSAANHAACQFGSTLLMNTAVTVTGTPTFSGTFANCFHLSYIACYGCTFSGGATGNRYVVGMLSMIAGTSGATYFPGTIAGTTDNGSLYG